MKHLFITVVLSIFPAGLYAGTGNDNQIEQFLNTCRHELNASFVNSQGVNSQGVKSRTPSESYLVGKVNGSYIVEINVQLRYPSNLSHAESIEAEQIFEEVKQWITQYYKNYGLKLNIHFEHAHFNRALSNPHPTPQEQSFVVYIRRNTGHHMKEIYWGLNRDWDFYERAKIIAHEFSHLLLLKDEYFTAIGAQTPQEEASYQNDSLMKNVDHPNPKLYLRHFKQILSPLCQQPLIAQSAQGSRTNFYYPH